MNGHDLTGVRAGGPPFVAYCVCGWTETFAVWDDAIEASLNHAFGPKVLIGAGFSH
jgi:hypothetical protein